MSKIPETKYDRNKEMRDMFESLGWKCLVEILESEKREIEVQCARRATADGVPLNDEDLKDLSINYHAKQHMIDLPKTLLKVDKVVDEKEEKSYNVYDSVGDDTEGIETLDPIDET